MTVFTAVGQDAMRELRTALKEQRPAKVTLIGHTDARGRADFNMRLSRERAAAVAGFLREAGVESQDGGLWARVRATRCRCRRQVFSARMTSTP